MNWILERLKDLETTVGGILLGGLAGAGMSIQSGEITKKAIIVGAVIGASGALMKTPLWMKIFKKSAESVKKDIDALGDGDI